MFLMLQSFKRTICSGDPGLWTQVRRSTKDPYTLASMPSASGCLRVKTYILRVQCRVRFRQCLTDLVVMVKVNVWVVGGSHPYSVYYFAAIWRFSGLEHAAAKVKGCLTARQSRESTQNIACT